MLYLMPIYFLFALVVVIKLVEPYQGWNKFGKFLLFSFFFYLPVGWDVMLGRAYFHYLCANDGGIHIYETVELGPEYWNEDGRPRFYTEDKGVFDSSIFGGKYIFSRSDTQYRGVFRTNRYLNQIIEAKTGKVFGEWVKYGTLGGWVTNLGTPFGKSEVRCHFSNDLIDNPLITGKALTNATGKVNTQYSKFTSYIFLNKETNKDDEL